MPSSLSLRTSLVELAAWSDAELLRACTWEGAADVELIAAAKAGDPTRFGAAWRKAHRARKESAGAIKELWAAWSPHPPADSLLGPALAALVPKPGKATGRRAAMKPQPSWLVRVQPLVKALTAGPHAQPLSAGELLIALELLWTVGERLPQRFWWPLWRNTLSDVIAGAQQTLAADAPPDERLVQTGEIPLLAGLVYRPLAFGQELIRKGQRVCTRELSSRTDTDGTPHGELLPRLPYWLAPLVRLTKWTQQAGQSLWDHDQQQLVSDLLEKSVALCRPDGKLALANGQAADALPLLRHAADLCGWPAGSPSRACLKSLAEHAAGKKPRSSGAAAISLMPSNQSDWARLAVLRSDWTATAATIALAHHASLPQIDLMIGGRSLLHGPWGLELRLGTSAIELADEWSCVCWESQPEADYAELQMVGPGKLRVERLVLLSREDQFLMLADSISGAPAGPLALRSRLPFAAGVQGSWDPGSRAGRLQLESLQARVYPLALPDDTVHSTPHRCSFAQDSLTLEQQGEGQGLFAPLIFDFDPQRRRKVAGWRKLTVTEDGKRVTGDIAAAYRWKVGKAQWLVYRSLKPPKLPRAALGYHTGNGFAIGRFDTNGDVDPILMVEE